MSQPERVNFEAGWDMLHALPHISAAFPFRALWDEALRVGSPGSPDGLVVTASLPAQLCRKGTQAFPPHESGGM